MWSLICLATTSLILQTPTIPLLLEVDVVSSPKKLQIGLQNKDDLAENQGMLFVFQNEDYHPFWMDKTPHKLALIFINKHGVVNDVQYGKPFSKKIIQGKRPYKYVLEIPKKTALQYHIQRGSSLEKLHEQLGLKKK